MAAQHSGTQHADASTIDKMHDWQSTQASTASDMLEDSCWTDLPDLNLTDSSGLQSELFASEVASSQSPSMFSLAEADFLLSARANDMLFSDLPESLTGMDMESMLADHDSMPTATTDKQLQPKTPSAPSNHLDDLLQQLYPSRSYGPASRETEQQESAATPFQDVNMVPERPASNPAEFPGCPSSDQAEGLTAGQVNAVPSAKPERVKKKPKIIVRLNIPASKKQTKGTKGRTSPRLAEKLPAAITEESDALLPVAKPPASVQQKRPLVMHETTRKSTSQDVSTQTDFPPESSPGEVPLLTSAHALAEGTRLLMAAPGGTFTSHQHAMQMPAGFTIAPWTLLTQSNIQLRLKPTVAAAGTQTEAGSQSDYPSASTVAIINNAAASRDTPMRYTETACASASQHATSTAAQLRPSQTSLATRASRTPVSPSKKKSDAQKRMSPSRIARHASHYRLSPNAHFMFQCQGGAVPYALPLPQDSPQHHCQTPVRTSEKVKCRPISLSRPTPPATAVTQPAADAAIDHPSNGPAAVLAADPSEILLADANKTASSCKSALPVRSAPGPVKRPSKAQPSPEALGLSNSASLGRPNQSAKEAALPNASGVSTAKRASICPSGQSHIADNANSAADAAIKATASAAAGLTASHEKHSSRAPATTDSASTDAIVTFSTSPQRMLGSVIDHPGSAAQKPAQVHGQERAQHITPVASAAPVPKAPSQPATAPSMKGKVPSAPRAPEATRPHPKAGVPGVKQGQDQAAAAAPGHPASGPKPDTPSHRATAFSKQSKQHVMAQPSTVPVAAAVAATSPRAVVRSKRKSTIPFRSRGKSQVNAETKELKTKEPKTREPLGSLSPCTADALRSDLVSTAGCHVTRRLVQHLLEPIPPPANGVRACPQPVRDAAETAGRNKSKVQPAACPGKGRGGSHSQAPQASRLPSSGTPSPSSGEANGCKQPPQAGTASDAPAAILSKGKASNADHCKKTGKDKQNHPEHQHSKQSPPLPADKATKPKATEVKLESKHARLRRAGKIRSVLELNQLQTVSGSAITSVADEQKPGSVTAADNQPAASGALVSSSTADKQEACGSNNVTLSGVGTAAAIMPSGSVGRSKEPKPTNSATQSGLKRLPSDASAALAPAKKHKSACATAAGLNPKFMATKNEVLRLIGKREGVLEAELRRSMGNNPDTSKALRKLHKEGALQRCGAGGRPDPFKWTKTSESQA